MKTLVISGGGNRGAGGAGKIARINGDFALGIGISTGALMVVPAMMGKFELLKEAYTTACQNDIFDRGKNPFTKKGHLKSLYTAWRILSGKVSLGESNNLRKHMAKYLTKGLFDEFKASGKEAVVGVYNEDYERMEYYSTKDCSYEDYIDWTWISACQPPAMTLVIKNGYEYSDGGVQEVFPMEEAVKRGASYIVGILHRPKELPVAAKENTKNILHRLFRLYRGSRRAIMQDDIRLGVMAANQKKVPYELHFVSYGYGENELVFDRSKMKEWYNQAFHDNLNPITEYKI